METENKDGKETESKELIETEKLELDSMFLLFLRKKDS